MKTLALLLPLLLTSCIVVRQPLTGTPFSTNGGFRFYWLGPTDLYPTPSALADAIDQQFDVWASLHPDLDNAYLRAVASYYPIQCFVSYHVDGNNPWYRYEGYIWYGSQIDIALLGSFYDPYWSRTLTGVEILLHEWEHALRGNFH